MNETFVVPLVDNQGRVSPEVLPTAARVEAMAATSHALQSADAGKLLVFTSDDPVTLTVHAGTLAAGERVDCSQRGDGAVTVVAGSGMALNPMPGMTLVSEGKHSVWTILAHSDSDADVLGWMAAE